MYKNTGILKSHFTNNRIGCLSKRGENTDMGYQSARYQANLIGLVDQNSMEKYPYSSKSSRYINKITLLVSHRVTSLKPDLISMDRTRFHVFGCWLTAQVALMHSIIGMEKIALEVELFRLTISNSPVKFRLKYLDDNSSHFIIRKNSLALLVSPSAFLAKECFLLFEQFWNSQIHYHNSWVELYIKKMDS